MGEINYSLYVDEEILKVAEFLKKDKYNTFLRRKVTDVSERMSGDIKRLLDIDVSGYTVNANTSTFEHIEKRHGENGEHDNSMKDMRDVAMMRYVLENYDDVEVLLNSEGEMDTTSAFQDKDENPAKMIRFNKEIGSKHYVVVAIPESKYMKVWVMTEYKEKDTSQTSHDENVPPPTPEANLDTVSSSN